MTKRVYLSPEIEDMKCEVECGIAVSTNLWYEQEAQGDFSYTVDEDTNASKWQ